MKNVLAATGLRVHTVPKVASTSQSAAMAWDIPRRVGPDEPSDAWRFMCVRHPLDRLVSAWQYFTPGSKLKHMAVFHHNVWPDMTFPQFLTEVLKDPKRDRHTRPQVAYRGNQPMHQLVRLENLRDAWGSLIERGLPVRPIQHKNKTDNQGWQAHFDAAMARDALSLFEADLEMYENAT